MENPEEQLTEIELVQTDNKSFGDLYKVDFKSIPHKEPRCYINGYDQALLCYHDIHLVCLILVAILTFINILVPLSIDRRYYGMSKGDNSDTANVSIVITTLSHMYLILLSPISLYILSKKSKHNPDIKDRLILEQEYFVYVFFLTFVQDMIYYVVLIDGLVKDRTFNYMFNRAPMPVIFGIIGGLIITIYVLMGIFSVLMYLCKDSMEENRRLLEKYTF